MQAIWMLAASLFFAAMSACIKFASAYFDPMEIVGYRGAIGILFVGALARSRGTGLKTQVPWMHVWRNVIGVSAMIAWFFAIAHLPLATAITLQYMSSVWIALFIVCATLITGQLTQMRQQGPSVVAIMIGFAGVIMVLGPTLEANQMFAGVVGLMGGIMAAMAYMQVAALGRIGEPDSRTVFYFSIGCMLAGLGSMLLFGAHPINHRGALWLIPMGVFGAIGQLCMTRAYTRGATIVVANLQYSGIVFGAILGLLLFGDHIPPIGWAGIATIVASGMAATALRARAAATSPQKSAQP